MTTAAFTPDTLAASPTPASTPSGCRRTSPSSWTATAAGPTSAACRASRATPGRRRASARTVEECCRLGVGQLTLYCLSSENWKRPQTELDFLMALLEQYLVEERAEIMEQNIRFSRHRPARGPARRRPARDRREHRADAATTPAWRLCLAINYGGRTEIIDAVRDIAARVRDGQARASTQIDEAEFSSSLYTAGMPDPDLLIRTAGEMRVSNFLLWQITYAELWVTERCWPDFDIPTLHQALPDYARRERRFGGLK